MRGYVSLQCRFWVESSTWPLSAKLLFLWSWTNSHVHGVTGIGEVSDMVIRAETGLTRAQLRAAKQYLENAERVKFFNNFYWVVKRMSHTCFLESGKENPKMVASARNFFHSMHLPKELVEAVSIPYRWAIDGVSMGYGRGISPRPRPNPNPRPRPNPRPNNPPFPPCQQGGHVGVAKKERKPHMNWNTVEEHFPADEIARAKDIFEHHCRVMSDSPNRPRGWRWLPGIADLICKRLQNFSPEDIKQAALNLSKSDWHRGRRGGREYCDPGFLYRSDEQVDKWFNQGTVSSKGDHLKTDNEYDGIGDVGHVE